MWTRNAALIGSDGGSGCVRAVVDGAQGDSIHGGTGKEQCNRLSWSAVGFQASGIKAWSSAVQVADLGKGRGAGSVIGQVVSLGNEGIPDAVTAARIIGEEGILGREGSVVVDAAIVGGGVAGDGRVGEGQGSVVEDAAVVGGGVTGNGAVGQGHRSIVVDTGKVGSGVAGNGAVGEGHSSVAVDAPDFGGGGVTGNGAVGEGQRTFVEDAAVVGGGVTGNGAVGQGHRSIVVDTAEIGGGVAGDGGVGQGHGSVVVDAAAVGSRVGGDVGIGESQGTAVGDAGTVGVAVEVSVLDGEAGDRDSDAPANGKNLDGVVAADGDIGGAWAGDGDTGVNGDRAGQGDDSGIRETEINGVAGDGIGDGVAERTEAAVVGICNRERRADRRSGCHGLQLCRRIVVGVAGLIRVDGAESGRAHHRHRCGGDCARHV